MNEHDPEERDPAGALAEGEVIDSRQLARAWTLRGTRFRIAGGGGLESVPFLSICAVCRLIRRSGVFEPRKPVAHLADLAVEEELEHADGRAQADGLGLGVEQVVDRVGCLLGDARQRLDRVVEMLGTCFGEQFTFLLTLASLCLGRGLRALPGIVGGELVSWHLAERQLELAGRSRSLRGRLGTCCVRNVVTWRESASCT